MRYNMVTEGGQCVTIWLQRASLIIADAVVVASFSTVTCLRLRQKCDVPDVALKSVSSRCLYKRHPGHQPMSSTCAVCVKKIHSRRFFVFALTKIVASTVETLASF